MTEDQVFVPKTRSERGLPPLNPEGENLEGSRVSEKVMSELYDALGDSPIGATWGAFSYLVSLSLLI
jgi:omega-6 fatty acid desaturase (delta-12 desaturase)